MNLPKIQFNERNLLILLILVLACFLFYWGVREIKNKSFLEGREAGKSEILGFMAEQLKATGQLIIKVGENQFLILKPVKNE